MGHSLSFTPKSAKLHREARLEGKGQRYPLLIESLMLRQIRKNYQASKDCKSTNLVNGDGKDHNISVTEGKKLFDKGDVPCKSLQELLLEQVVNKFDANVTNDVSEVEAQAHLTSKTCESASTNDIDENLPKDKNLFKITDFPILVVERVLEYLNPSAILALRATCTATKTWIDDNDYILRNFKVKITPEHCKYHYEAPHTAPWSNFSIPFVHLDSAFIQETIDNYAEIIWNLEIYPPKSLCSAYNYPSNHPRRLFEMVGRCHQLERLKICRMDTLTQLPKENNCFQCLRVLAIDRIQWMNHSDFPLFEKLIMNCPLLEYLKVPEYEILGSLAFIFYDQNASPEKEHLIRPVIRYLDRYRRPSGGNEVAILARKRQHAKLYIDVVEFEDFKLCSSEVFYELSRKCLECNSVLMNVYFVPRDAVLRNEQNIVESFASMFGFIKIDFHAELWKNLEVMECWIEDFPDDLQLTIRQFEFLKTVSKIQTLRSLTIRMCVDNPDVCSGALEACVGQKYLGVKKLILRRHQVTPDTFVTIPPGFGSAFSNLKFLYFQELDSRDEDFFQLWPTLPNLEELFIYKCPHLTEAAFLGDTEQQEVPMLKLTKLQILVIFLFDGVGGFSDEFLIKGLRHMKLKGFALRGGAGVEFTDNGMLSLLNSPFHDTIEDFEAPSSCFRPALSSNYWSFYVALPKKELRRNRIWLSCSVLLSSLSSRKHPYDYDKKCLGI